MGSLLLSPGSWCTQGVVCALQESVSPVLCKFWWLYGVVNGGLLQEGLCHTQVCCTQSPCPCGRPQLTCTTTGDTQTFKDRTGSVQSLWGLWVLCAQSLFETSKCLWQVMGFDSKCDFTPLTILLGLLLCPWMWISFGGSIFPVNSYSVATCNSGVLPGEDEHRFS